MQSRKDYRRSLQLFGLMRSSLVYFAWLEERAETWFAQPDAGGELVVGVPVDLRRQSFPLEGAL